MWYHNLGIWWLFKIAMVLCFEILLASWHSAQQHAIGNLTMCNLAKIGNLCMVARACDKVTVG